MCLGWVPSVMASSPYEQTRLLPEKRQPMVVESPWSDPNPLIVTVVLREIVGPSLCTVNSTTSPKVALCACAKRPRLRSAEPRTVTVPLAEISVLSHDALTVNVRLAAPPSSAARRSPSYSMYWSFWKGPPHVAPRWSPWMSHLTPSEMIWRTRGPSWAGS